MRTTTPLLTTLLASTALALPNIAGWPNNMPKSPPIMSGSAEHIINDIQTLKDTTNALTEYISKLETSKIYGTEGDVQFIIENIADDLEKEKKWISSNDVQYIVDAMHEARPYIMTTLEALNEKSDLCYNDYYTIYSQVSGVVQDLQFSVDKMMDGMVSMADDREKDRAALMQEDQDALNEAFEGCIDKYSRSWWSGII